MHYHAYGTTLQSDLPWAGLPSANSTRDAIETKLVRISKLPVCEPLLTVRQLQGRTMRVLGSFPDVSVQIDDLLLFSLDLRNRTIHCYAEVRVSDELVAYWMLRQIVPIARLLWDQTDVLHAGAVRIGDGVAAFLAPSGTGKSTLVGHFVANGHKLVTDDHLFLQAGNIHRDATWALPSIPFYRNYRRAESLGHHTGQFDPSACRLGAVYVLRIADPASAVQASAIPDAKAALQLLHQAPYNLIDLEVPFAIPLARRRFEFLSTLPLGVPVRHLDVPRDLKRLPEVADYVSQDFQEVAGLSHARV